MKPITTSSAVEFLVVLLIAASVTAIVAKRFRFPYTVALVIGGLLLSWLRLPHFSPLVLGQRPDWLTPDVILFLFLPALVFEGSLKLQLRELQHDSASLLLLANFGVLVAAFVAGYLVHWSTRLPVAVALLFNPKSTISNAGRSAPSCLRNWKQNLVKSITSCEISPSAIWEKRKNWTRAFCSLNN